MPAKFKCDVCGFTAKNGTGLSVHRRSRHNAGEPPPAGPVGYAEHVSMAIAAIDTRLAFLRSELARMVAMTVEAKELEQHRGVLAKAMGQIDPLEAPYKPPSSKKAGRKRNTGTAPAPEGSATRLLLTYLSENGGTVANSAAMAAFSWPKPASFYSARTGLIKRGLAESTKENKELTITHEGRDYLA